MRKIKKVKAEKDILRSLTPEEAGACLTGEDDSGTLSPIEGAHIISNTNSSINWDDYISRSAITSGSSWSTVSSVAPANMIVKGSITAEGDIDAPNIQDMIMRINRLEARIAFLEDTRQGFWRKPNI